MKFKFLTFLIIISGFLMNATNADAQVDSTWTDCDCPEPTEEDGVCVLFTYFLGDSTTSITDTTWMPSECLALCYGFTPDQILGHCDWEDVIDTTWNDCNCPEIYEPVCVQDSSGFVFEMQNECYALCFGFTVVSDSLCDQYDPWEDCDCPDIYEPVCVQDSSGFVFEMQNECYALCFGFTVVSDSLCDHYDPWEDCNCPDIYEPVCAQDSSGFVFEMPNECYALCLGFTVVSDSLCDQYDDPWEDCDCPEPTEEDGVCVTYSYFLGDSTNVLTDTTWMPSECLALCFGFTPEQIVGHCNWEDNWNDTDTTWINCDCPDPVEGEGVCVSITYYLGDSTNFISDTLWFESECLAFCYGFSQDDLIADCQGDEANNRFLAKNKEAFSTDEIVTYPNPFSNEFTISSESIKNGRITITSVDGRRVYSESFDQIKTIDGSGFNPGIYIVTLTGNNISITNRIVRMK
ncbi:MAG: T9SS type A sorting domain-containing protein [Deltaproteobacteria bacterium]